LVGFDLTESKSRLAIIIDYYHLEAAAACVMSLGYVPELSCGVAVS